MVWWTLVAGALIGWASAGFSEFGLILGAIFGTPMGFWLRSVMRAETDQMISQRIASLYIPEAGSFDYEREERPEPAPPFGTVPASAASPLPAAAQPVPAEPAMAMAAAGEPLAQSEHDHIAATPNRDPDRPSLPEELAQKAIGWLLGGNTIVRVGLVVLFIGLAFLARLVANSGLFPIEARLATVGAAGAALLAVGYWKRLERPDFGLHLQGAGVAVLYLTVFAAARIFEVMPPGAAFAFMILFAALGAALALLQNSQTMALASFLGGFAVPFLLGGSAETPTGLFTYITVLNAAIMGIAWKKSWRPLNLLGFAATFLLAGLWGFGAYENWHFIICEVFLAFSIAIYLATALLYAHNTPGKLGNFADSTLLFGTAIAGFGLQAGLVHDKPFASAWSAVVFGAVYLAVATWAFRRRNQGMGLLSESLLAIGLGFVTMAIPLALELKWVSVAWLLEGAGALWVGARQARWMPRAFGLLLQAAGALSGASPYFFRIWNSDAFEGEVVSTYLKSTYPDTRLGILYVNNDYGKGLYSVVAKAFSGGRVVAGEAFDKDARDFRSQIARLKAASPNVIYLVGYAGQTGPASRQLREAGLNVPIVGTVAMEDAEYIKAAGPTADGVVYPFPSAPTGPTAASFKDSFKAAYHKAPGLLHDCGYDAAQLVLGALRSGAISGDQVRAFLAQTKDFRGASGTITFDAQGDVHKPMQMKVIQHGAFVSLP